MTHGERRSAHLRVRHLMLARMRRRAMALSLGEAVEKNRRARSSRGVWHLARHVLLHLSFRRGDGFVPLFWPRRHSWHREATRGICGIHSRSCKRRRLLGVLCMEA